MITDIDRNNDCYYSLDVIPDWWSWNLLPFLILEGDY